MKFEKIAIIAGRELALGFKLIGVKDSFIAEGTDAAELFAKFMEAKSYNLIMISESVKAYMNTALKRMADSSIVPLVVFIPLPSGDESKESIEVLAKRVLGVNIKKMNI